MCISIVENRKSEKINSHVSISLFLLQFQSREKKWLSLINVLLTLYYIGYCFFCCFQLVACLGTDHNFIGVWMSWTIIIVIMKQSDRVDLFIVSDHQKIRTSICYWFVWLLLLFEKYFVVCCCCCYQIHFWLHL